MTPRPPLMPCGHPESAVVQADEGTAYCGECAKAAVPPSDETVDALEAALDEALRQLHAHDPNGSVLASRGFLALDSLAALARLRDMEARTYLKDAEAAEQRAAALDAEVRSWLTTYVTGGCEEAEALDGIQGVLNAHTLAARSREQQDTAGGQA